MHAVTSEINRIKTLTTVTVDPSTVTAVVSDQPIDTATCRGQRAGCQPI